jgi:hypothetical protein
MPSTYQLISSNVLSSTAASVTFSAIPATYTDLVLKTSLRSDSGLNYDQILLRFNAESGSRYSDTYLSSLGTAANSSQSADATASFMRFSGGDSAPANTFSNGEIYIPSYTASQRKPFFNFMAAEDNISTARLAMSASLFRESTVISSISCAPTSGTVWSAGSSFYLYGVKNS